MFEIEHFEIIGKAGTAKSWRSVLTFLGNMECGINIFLKTWMKWDFDNMGSLKALKESLKPRNLKAKRLWNQETKNPRNQTNQETTKPRAPPSTPSVVPFLCDQIGIDIQHTHNILSSISIYFQIDQSTWISIWKYAYPHEFLVDS